MALSGPVTKNKDVKFRFVVRQDQSDGFRKNLFLNKSDTSRKDELTLRLKIDFELSETSNSKLLLSSVDMDDPADIWTIDNSLNTLSADSVLRELSMVHISAGSSISTELKSSLLLLVSDSSKSIFNLRVNSSFLDVSDLFKNKFLRNPSD